MSRILRRPMFRGGRVDSRGTGITSGLMDDTGYADGGRVGFQVGGGLFSSGPYNPYSANNIFSGTSLGYSPTLNFSTSPKPLFSDYDPLANTSTNTMMQDRDRRIKEAEERNRQSISGRTRVGLPPVKDYSIYRQEYIDTFGTTPTARDLMDYGKRKDKYQESTEEVNIVDNHLIHQPFLLLVVVIEFPVQLVVHKLMLELQLWLIVMVIIFHLMQ